MSSVICDYCCCCWHYNHMTWYRCTYDGDVNLSRDDSHTFVFGRNEVRKALIAAVQRTNCSNNRVWSAFWAAHQRFFRQLWYVSLITLLQYCVYVCILQHLLLFSQLDYSDSCGRTFFKIFAHKMTNRNCLHFRSDLDIEILVSASNCDIKSVRHLHVSIKTAVWSACVKQIVL